MDRTAKFRRLTLGITSHKQLWIDPEGIKTTGGFGRQIEAFAGYFNKTVLVVPCESYSTSQPGNMINIDNLKIIHLPYFNGKSLQGKLDFLFFKAAKFFCLLWRVYPDCDVWQYRLSSYVGLLGLIVHKLRRSRPGFVWLGTDWPDRIRQSGNTLPRRLMASILERLLSCLLRDIPIFALGKMAGRFSNHNLYTHQAISTVLKSDEIVKKFSMEMSSPPKLLFVGRLAFEKGLRYLIRALKICLCEGYELQLILVGEGPEQSSLNRMLAQLNLEQYVTFEGFISQGKDLWEQYRKADIFVLPSLSEGQGKVLIEAMAAGMPIVATRVGGIPTVIENGKNGLLVEPRSPEALAKAVKRILDEPELRYSLAKNAIDSAYIYTIEKQTKEIIQALSDDLILQGWVTQ